MKTIHTFNAERFIIETMFKRADSQDARTREFYRKNLFNASAIEANDPRPIKDVLFDRKIKT